MRRHEFIPPPRPTGGRNWRLAIGQPMLLERRMRLSILESNIFRSANPRRIANSLNALAKHSKRRKATPYQSAMSMLNFYINRAGKGLSKRQRAILERAKSELRKTFGRRRFACEPGSFYPDALLVRERYSSAHQHPESLTQANRLAVHVEEAGTTLRFLRCPRSPAA